MQRNELKRKKNNIITHQHCGTVHVTCAEALIDHHSMHRGGFACRSTAASKTLYWANGIKLSSLVPHPLTLIASSACHKHHVMAQGLLLSKACSAIVAQSIAAGE